MTTITPPNTTSTIASWPFQRRYRRRKQSHISTVVCTKNDRFLAIKVLFVTIPILMGILSIIRKQTITTASAASFFGGGGGGSTNIPATTSSHTTTNTRAAFAFNTATTGNEETPTTMADLEDRLRGALWGFLAGDALASPTHWYYGGRRQIINEYGHEITGYTKPNRQLVGSIMNKSDLNGGGRAKGGKDSSGRAVTIIGDVINHGKQDLWRPGQDIHYHATLQAGENTLEVSIARVLMKSIVSNGGTFNADHFRTSYVTFMTTPGSHNDAYASTCHRMFFANMIFKKLPPKDCPDNDSHNVDTQDGLVLPTIVALTGLRDGVDEETIQRAAAECVAVTRRSTVLQRVSSQWAKVVLSAVRERNNDAYEVALDEFSQRTIRRSPNSRVDDASTMSACYLDSALPGLIDMAAKYSSSSTGNSRQTVDNDADQRVWQGLLSNANVGGENVHRGSVLGAVLGARAGYHQLPSQLVQGLYPQAELQQEIDDFVRAILPKN